MENCIFKKECSKYGTSECSTSCYAYVYTRGLKGNGGLKSTTNVPGAYAEYDVENLPTLAPEKTDRAVRRYLSQLPKVIKDGVGLYLYGKRTTENPLGTGNGKTTSAITVLNEYVKQRAKEHLTGIERITVAPALFVKMSDFQNLYNSQFRGTSGMQEQASLRYYTFKERMKDVELLVLDDVATRSGTEAFVNEFFEVVDDRISNRKAMILTSNCTIGMLQDIYGERIVSRIEGACHSFEFTDKDYRRVK